MCGGPQRQRTLNNTSRSKCFGTVKGKPGQCTGRCTCRSFCWCQVVMFRNINRGRHFHAHAECMIRPLLRGNNPTCGKPEPARTRPTFANDIIPNVRSAEHLLGDCYVSCPCLKLSTCTTCSSWRLAACLSFGYDVGGVPPTSRCSILCDLARKLRNFRWGK